MRAVAVMSVLLAFSACGGSNGDDGGPSPAGSNDPGAVVSTKLSAAQQAELDALNAQLAEVKDLDAAGFEKKYAVPFATSLGYDPMTAKGLDLVDGSPMKLVDAEKARLAADGFVVSERVPYPTFIDGYAAIYTADLPVYVSADSVMYAVHRSFDAILANEEQTTLVPALTRMLASMRSAVSAGALSAFSAQTRADVDLYLTVASALLTGESPGGAASDFVTAAVAHQGQREITLFGVKRDEDFSQFEPRGHYTLNETLGRYFRAMIWLGRVDLRILETQPDHSQVFRRRQLEAAYALRATMNAETLADWKKVDEIASAFVGEQDNMTLPQLDALLTDLGLASALDLGKKTDAEIAQAVVNGGYGTQRIASHIMVNGLSSGTMPLSSTFLLLGQRYTVDSHVFSNVVYDRVQGGNVKRMMPDPLDVGFAALRNDHAGILLLPEIQKYGYASDLASMRIVVDAHPQSFWDASLYHQWVGAIRALSERNTPGLPIVANTEHWGRRILNAQLASWAELRHDTILYAKQSYTGSPGCEYPDAYVEPYPELFARIASYASRGAALPISATSRAYFEELRSVASVLETMAKDQRTGAQHSAEHVAFINQLVFQQGCGSIDSFNGWYAKLFFDPAGALRPKPTITDVHTQPADEGGATVGNVLHVGTGNARAMVVTVDTCNGPRAYVGLASSYYQTITTNYERLTDEAWQVMLFGTNGGKPPPPSWMNPILQ